MTDQGFLSKETASRLTPDSGLIMSPEELDALLRNVGHINYKGQLTIQGIREIHRILRASHSDAIETAILLDFRERVAQQALTPDAYAELQALCLYPLRESAYAALYDVQEDMFRELRDYLQRVPITQASPAPAKPHNLRHQRSFGNDFMNGFTLGWWGRSHEEDEQ